MRGRWFCTTARGLPRPGPWGTFLYGQKGTKKPPGEFPRSPRHRPEGDAPFGVLFALRPNWFGSMDSAYPSSAGLLRLPTGSNVLPAVAVQVSCTSTQRVPVADSTPLRGRQAELFKYQTTRSEPRRKLSFTGHRSSSFAERVRKSPAEAGRPVGTAPSKGVQNHWFWRLFGYFLSAQKVTPGVGRAAPQSYQIETTRLAPCGGAKQRKEPQWTKPNCSIY